MTDKKEIDEKNQIELKLSDDHDYPWNTEHEEILCKWADKAVCYKVMHDRSYKRFWCMNAWFNIPVIIIATITGTGNFASASFGPNALMYTFIIGGFNIFSGIMATIATYIGAAQKCEGHRFATIHWDKFARKIQFELMKKRQDRTRVKIFMKQIIEEYDRLNEMSPILPNDIIRWFTDIVNEDEEQYTDCGICCHECFCFACGCNLCTSCLTRCIKDTEEKNTKSKWHEMTLPEIIGKIDKTTIAQIDEVKCVQVCEENNEENIYNIYTN
jgi:hypothetical protein